MSQNRLTTASGIPYEPVNAFGQDSRDFGDGDAVWPLEGLAGRQYPRGVDDDTTQAGNLYRLMAADAQDRLTTNIANAMCGEPVEIRVRQLAHFTKADARYGAEVARKLEGR